MRSALICVFLALVVQKGGSRAENEENFKPTPIPLSDWPRDKQEAAGTLQEIIKTEAPATEAAVPAHYWEDALKHSVYLTLVRDQIDQLIEKREIASQDMRLDEAKTIDDHGLWEKIKTAPFERQIERNIPPGDVTILARGRLIEDGEGYRFIEDDVSQNNCTGNNCLKDAKAFWSVKRIRQKETSPGKYHYELTFSVMSQTTKKVKKPFRTPVRTFTIRENSPNEHPQARHYQQVYHTEKPQRIMWVHKNINTVLNNRKVPLNSRGLDRIFSSLFSDEDKSYDELPYRHKPKNYFPQVYPQHSKVGYVEDRDINQQKKLIPYAMTKQQAYRYTHPPIPPPPLSYVQHPYLNVDHIGNIPYVQQYPDNRYVPSNVVKTTRPAVLPTPITNYPLLKESTIEVPVKTKLNATEYTTKVPDVVTTYKIHNHPKQSPVKVSYFPDHIRPPVYNAPPGVFVTMDKKPFKPMPPLKYVHSNKPQKTMLPDFRPSPQVLDSQFSELDSDTAFRPITMNYTEPLNVKDGNGDGRKGNKNIRKPSAAKKPTKKHENIKSHRLTTITPEIITVQSEEVEEDSSMEWANLLGAFTKTTPMASNRERGTTEISEPITSTTPSSTTFIPDDSSEVYYDSFEAASQSVVDTTTTTTTTTTPKPRKRTRPPPKFSKAEKIKKHKRVTSTTTTTIKPTRKHPVKKISDDLTPQASSAATSGTNSVREFNTHKAPSTTTTSSTTPRTTTTIKLTTTSTSTTTSPSSTTVETEQPVATTQPKSKNRFRQSTLMQKGTSVNHDKWSTTTLEKNRTTSVTSPNFSVRRKASKFHGYIPASTPRSPEVERDREDHRDHAYNSNKEYISSTTTEKSEDILVKVPETTRPTLKEQAIPNERPPEWPQEEQTEEYNEHEDEQKETDASLKEFKDDNEYIFPTASITHEVKSEYISLEKQSTTTEITVVASPHSATKNKTKCKKKKHNNLLTTEGALEWSSETESTTSPTANNTTTSTTTASAVTPDIFDELFGGFTMDDATEKPETEHSTPTPEQNQSESETHERYVHLDDDIEDFLHSLDQKSNRHAEYDESDEEYDDDDDEDSPFNNHEENFDNRNLNDEYDEAEKDETSNRPFNLLDWAME